MHWPLNPEVEAAFAATLEVAEPERQAFLAREYGGNPELRAEVESLLQAYGAIGSFLEGTPAINPESLAAGPLELPSGLGRYRIVRLLGEGAMGTVYEAEQEQPRRTVALKVIKPGLASPELLRRFELESEALGRLQHPGIAQIYEAGTGETASGHQPYFAMEFIRGESLIAYAEARNLTLRQRLEIMVKVCEAVHHAHQRGIIHRDLKPGNILVDESGQPKILDFGVARVTDSDAYATRETDVGHLVGTLAYMSPEQVLADPLELDTRSDVYGLGVILFELLAGRLPYTVSRQWHETVRAIREQEPARLGLLNHACRGDIETIAAKALEKEKTRRYGSAAELAADIQRYLTDEPILARRGNGWYRAGKFLRRYPMPVAAIVLILASLLGGLYFANRQRIAAERRFAQLQQLSSKVFDLDQALAALPGSTSARQRLVAASLEYLRGLAAESRGDLDLAQELGEGYWRVARIQGVPTELNLGQRTQAEESLERADAFTDIVLASRPRHRRALLRSAVIAQDRMILASEDHRREEALAQARRAGARLDAFLRLGALSERERVDTGTVYDNLALAHVNLHLYDGAIGYARRAIEVVQPAPSAQPLLAGAYSLFANAYRYQGDLEHAFQAIEQARTIAEHILFANDTDRMVNLFGIYLREGFILGEDEAPNLNRPPEAVAALQKALDLAEAAARKDALDSTSRGRIANAGNPLGNILRHFDPKRALAVYDLSIRRLREIPNHAVARRDEAMVLANSSYALRSLHRNDEARQRIDRALAILKDTKDYPGQRIPLASELFVAVRAQADYEAALGDPRHAVGLYEQLLNQVMAANPDFLNDLREVPRLSDVYGALAALYRRTGETKKAESLEMRRLELWQHWDRKLPSNQFILRQLTAKPALHT